MTLALSIRELEKRYDGRRVLRAVNLRIEPGERVALVGPNGSGKTTLMRAVLGFVRCTGEVRVCGFDPWRAHEAALARVAYMPQRAPALPAPVGELVSAWCRIREVPERDLAALATTFGLDIEALGTVRFTALSGGMQQKLLAAMALASSADFLLLDEPTANLDPAAREVFLHTLARRSPPPTLLLSSHRLEELRDLVDRVIVLTDGEVRFDDRLDAFLERPGLAGAAGLVVGPGVVPFRRPS